MGLSLNPTSIATSVISGLVGSSAGSAVSSAVNAATGGGNSGATQPDLMSMLHSTTADLHNQTFGTPAQASITPAASPVSQAIGQPADKHFVGQGPTVSPSVGGGDERSRLENAIRALEGDSSNDDEIARLKNKLADLVMRQDGFGAAPTGQGAAQGAAQALGQGASAGQGAASDPDVDAGESLFQKGMNLKQYVNKFMENGEAAVKKAVEDLGKGDVDALQKDLDDIDFNAGNVRNYSAEAEKDMHDGAEQVFGKHAGALQALLSGGQPSADSHADLSGLGGSKGSAVTSDPRSSDFDFGELDVKKDALGIISKLNAYNDKFNEEMASLHG